MSWKQSREYIIYSIQSQNFFAEEYKEHNLKEPCTREAKNKALDFVDRKTIRFMGSGSAYNYIAGKCKDSGLEDKEVSNFKTGCHGFWRSFN